MKAAEALRLTFNAKTAKHGSSGSLRARKQLHADPWHRKDGDRFRSSHHALRIPYQVAAHTVRPSAVHCFAQRRRPHDGRRRSRRRPARSHFRFMASPPPPLAMQRRQRCGVLGRRRSTARGAPGPETIPAAAGGSRRNDRSAERVSPLHPARRTRRGEPLSEITVHRRRRSFGLRGSRT